MDDFTEILFGISLLVGSLLTDLIRIWSRYHCGFDCDKCGDWLCPHHGCMKRKKK